MSARRGVIISVALLMFSGCVSARSVQRYPSLVPTAASTPTRSIGFYRLVSTIPVGAEVGTIQTGLACVGQGRQFWLKTGDFDPSLSSYYTGIAAEEFRKAGYLVIAEPAPTEGASLFQPPAGGPTPELLVGIVIRSAASNICYPWAGFANRTTTQGDASMEVEWQIFDPAAQRMVLTRVVGGYGVLEQGNHGVRHPVHEAFAASARNLLADGSVALALSARSVGPSPSMLPPPPGTPPPPPPSAVPPAAPMPPLAAPAAPPPGSFPTPPQPFAPTNPGQPLTFEQAKAKCWAEAGKDAALAAKCSSSYGPRPTNLPSVEDQPVTAPIVPRTPPAMSAPPPAASTPAPTPAGKGAVITPAKKAQIELLERLRDSGSLTADQFEIERAKVILAPAN